MGKEFFISRRFPFWMMVAAIVIGSNFAGQPPEPWYPLYRDALDCGGRALDDMEGLLRRYKADHGRYPATAEGLSVLEGYALRYRLRQCHWPLGFSRWRFLRQPWPRNEEELLAYLKGGQKRMGGDERGDPNLPGLEAGICDSGFLHLLYLGEPLDITNTPYFYENRPAGAKSLMPTDPWGMFSRQLDSGVRIGSFGLQSMWDKARPVKLRWIAKGLVFGACVAALGCWLVLWWIRDRRKGDPDARFSARQTIVILLWLALGFLVVWAGFNPVLCPAYQTPESVCRYGAQPMYCDMQVDLLVAGLINQPTYDRRVAANKLEDDVRREESMARLQAYEPKGPHDPPPTTGPGDANAPTGGN